MSKSANSTERTAKKEEDLINRMKESAGGAPPRSDGYRPVSSQGASSSQEATDNIKRALRVSEATNTSGYATIQSLGRQRETIAHSLETVGTTHQNLQESRQVIRDIRWSVYKEWLVKGCVIGALVLLIVLIFWSKFIRSKN